MQEKLSHVDKTHEQVQEMRLKEILKRKELNRLKKEEHLDKILE